MFFSKSLIKIISNFVFIQFSSYHRQVHTCLCFIHREFGFDISRIRILHTHRAWASSIGIGIGRKLVVISLHVSCVKRVWMGKAWKC